MILLADTSDSGAIWPVFLTVGIWTVMMGGMATFFRWDRGRDRERKFRENSYEIQKGKFESFSKEPGLRADDSDRDLILEVLAKSLADGALTLEKYNERAAAVSESETRGELLPLVQDLPRWADAVRDVYIYW